MADKQGKHVFISYVHEDTERVDVLCKVLDAAQIPYWRDRKSLAHGDLWKVKIREAIQSGSLVFLACFSDNSRAKSKSYMNEELTLAIEEFRKMPPGRTWMIPIRFDDGDVPPWDLGAGRMLGDVHLASLFGDSYAPEAAGLVMTIGRLMGSDESSLENALVAADEAGSAERSAALTRLTKEMLPDPNRRIHLEELISRETRRIVKSLENPSIFPTTIEAKSGAERTSALVNTAERYWELVEPFCHTLQVAARWGSPDQLTPWARAIKQLVNHAIKIEGGFVPVLNLRHVPAVSVIVVAAIAASASGRWENFRVLLADQTVIDQHGRGQTEDLLSNTAFYRPFRDDDVAESVLARVRKDEIGVEEAHAYYVKHGGLFHTPFADWLHIVAKPVFDDQFVSDDEYDHAFDQAEVLLGVVSHDLSKARYQDSPGADYLVRAQWFGRSTWRAANRFTNQVEDLGKELSSLRSAWPPLAGGLFGGDVTRANDAISLYQKAFNRARNHMF